MIVEVPACDELVVHDDNSSLGGLRAVCLLNA